MIELACHLPGTRTSRKHDDYQTRRERGVVERDKASHSSDESRGESRWDLWRMELSLARKFGEI